MTLRDGVADLLNISRHIVKRQYNASVPPRPVF
jgi:hypothetical protein